MVHQRLVRTAPNAHGVGTLWRAPWDRSEGLGEHMRHRSIYSGAAEARAHMPQAPALYLNL